jgi:arylsulfatase A-like enzyme
MVITTDFSVTMLALAGLSRPPNMSGRDLCQLTKSSEPEWRDAFYYDHPYGHQGAIPRTEGVRTEQYAYMRYRDTTPLFEQLFDLYADPCQRDNLATASEHQNMSQELLNQMRKQCDSLAGETATASQ